MRSVVLWVLFLVVLACAPAQQEAEPAVEPEPPAAPAEVADSYPDPDEAVASEVQDFVTAWVEERVAEDGTLAVQSRAGQEVQGTMADFHTVHQKDADTYSVCVDFRGAEGLYDVDFFIDRSADGGLLVADHYLHKIDGEAVE